MGSPRASRRRISLNDYKVRNVVSGAEPTVRDAKRGDVAWIPDRSHTGKNIGNTEMDCVLVELKEPRKRAPLSSTNQMQLTAPAQAK